MTYQELSWHIRKLSEKLKAESEARLRAHSKAVQQNEAQKQRLIRTKRA